MALGKRQVTAKTTAAKKETHPVVIVNGKDFASKLKRFNDLKEDIKNLTADQKAIEGDIKATCLDQYIDLYTSGKRNPESIKVESDSGDRVMFMVVKKYSGAVDEERATDLREKYGQEFVEEKSELIMNNDLLNKYSEKLEALIMSADFMTEEEKEELFVNKITYSIKSEAINEAFTVANGDVKGLISDVNPVMMLKETR